MSVETLKTDMKREKYNENNGTNYPRIVENYKRFNIYRRRKKREKEAEEIFE